MSSTSTGIIAGDVRLVSIIDKHSKQVMTKVAEGSSKAAVMVLLGYSIETEGLLLNDRDGVALSPWTVLSLEKGPYEFWNTTLPAAPPAPAPATIPDETVQILKEMAVDYMDKKNTIVLSHATSSAKNDVLDMLDMKEVGASWPSKPNDGEKAAGATRLPTFPFFGWLSGDEDTEKNRAAYMAHLTSHLRLPEGYSLADLQPDRTVLSVDLPGKEKRRKISGTTDVAIATVANVANNCLRNNVECLLELETPNNMKRKNHHPQTVCEHVAASYLNQNVAVVSVLTDLNRSWTFYWFASHTCEAGVALYKLSLPKDDKTDRSANLAKYILDHLFDKSPEARNTLPTTFVDRLSFRAVKSTWNDSRSNSRERHDDGSEHGDRSGGGGGGCSEDDQDGGTGSSGHCWQGSNNTQGDKQRSNGQRGSTSHNDGSSYQAMSSAEFLSLFAPQANRDVANELDLLDVVDEEEQHAMVRSFAAKYIVPRITGHECELDT